MTWYINPLSREFYRTEYKQTQKLPSEKKNLLIRSHYTLMPIFSMQEGQKLALSSHLFRTVSTRHAFVAVTALLIFSIMHSYSIYSVFTLMY